MTSEVLCDLGGHVSLSVLRDRTPGVTWFQAATTEIRGRLVPVNFPRLFDPSQVEPDAAFVETVHDMVDAGNA